jgi:hypothetical protein
MNEILFFCFVYFEHLLSAAVAVVNRVPISQHTEASSQASSQQQHQFLNQLHPQSSLPINSFLPNLAQNSFMQSLMLSQHPLNMQQRALQQMQAQQMQSQAWTAAVAAAPHLFQGYQALPSPATGGELSNGGEGGGSSGRNQEAALPQAPSLKTTASVSSVKMNSQSSFEPRPESFPASNSNSRAASLTSIPPTSESLLSPSQQSDSDITASYITIPPSPSQIPMSLLDYIPASSRGACLSSLPPPANRSVSCRRSTSRSNFYTRNRIPLHCIPPPAHYTLNSFQIGLHIARDSRYGIICMRQP